MSNDNVYERLYKLLAKANMMVMDGKRDPGVLADLLQFIISSKGKPSWISIVGQLEALINKLGGLEVIQRILSDELKVEVVEGGYRDNGSKVVLTPPPADKQLRVDRHGRIIRPPIMQARVTDADWDFHLEQPSLDWALVLERIQKYFADTMKFPSLDEFKGEAHDILRWIENHPQISNLIKGEDLKVVHLPICLPQLETDDYGWTLEDIFLKAAANSYCEQFPGRNFINHRKGKLSGQVSIVEGTRHEQLLARMAEGPVTGIFFPNALQSYSINAAREILPSLSENVLLGGGFDTIIALTAYPDVLSRDFHTPGLDMAALSWRSSRYSLFCKAYDDDFHFGRADRLADADGNYSTGLLVLR